MGRPARQGHSILYDFPPQLYHPLWPCNVATKSPESLAGSAVGQMSNRSGRVGGAVATYLVSSPVDAKRTPASGLPEARDSRMLARFGPTCSIAAERQRTARCRGVPSGRRKIQGMLVEVRARSEEMPTTGTKDFTAICSARWLEGRSSAINADRKSVV